MGFDVLKKILRGLLKTCVGILVLLLAVAIIWTGWSLVAYRDIPVAELEKRYGDKALQRVDLDGVSLAYRVEGEGPPLLLLHSHYFNMRMWDDWVPTLAQYFTVIRFDMTSHGLTGPDSRDDYSMDRDLEHILGLLGHLQVERFAVMGSSLGGNMAFHLAGLYPDRVSHLALANSGGIPRAGSRGTQGTIPAWVDYVSYLVPTAAFRSFLEWMMFDDQRVSDQQVEEFHQMFRREGNRFAEFNRLRAFEVGDPTDTLASIRAPVLIIWGEENPQLPVTQAARFKELLTAAPQVTVLLMPEVGHVIPLEMPDYGSVILRDFLLSSPAGPTQ